MTRTRRPTSTKRKSARSANASRKSSARLQSNLDAAKQVAATVRSIIIDGAFLLLAVTLIVYIIAKAGDEFGGDIATIEKIVIPEQLNEFGLTDEIAVDKLKRAIDKVRFEAQNIEHKRPIKILKLGVLDVDPQANLFIVPAELLRPPREIEYAGHQIDVVVPYSGLSLKSIFRELHRLLDMRETVITGEFVCVPIRCKTGDDYSLTLHVTGDADPISLDPPNTNEPWEKYFHDAAIKLWRRLDPSAAAAALYGSNQSEALKIALEMVRANHRDKVWAINLIATAKYGLGDYDGVIAHYTENVKLDRALEDVLDAKAHAMWGDALMRKRSYTEAMTHYTKATELNPSFKGPLKNLLNWGKAKAFDVELAQSYVGLGDALYKEGNYDQAIDQYVTALQLDPNLAYTRLALGNALYQKGQYELAIEHYVKATETDPNLLEAYLNLGSALRIKHDYAGAVEQITKAIELDPNFASAYVFLGDALAAQGDYREAITHYAKAIALDPSIALAHTGWGNALSDDGDYDGGIEHYRMAAELDPNLPMAYVGLGFALGKKGDYVESDQNFAKAVELDPNFTHAYIFWGGMLRDKGDYDAANSKLEKAIRLDPNNAEFYGNLAYHRLLTGDFAGALEAADKAIALAPDQIWLHTNRAHALMFLGRVDEARKLYFRYRGEKNVQHGKSWDEVILDDFGALRKAKRNHLLMKEIAELFQADVSGLGAGATGTRRGKKQMSAYGTLADIDAGAEQVPSWNKADIRRKSVSQKIVFLMTSSRQPMCWSSLATMCGRAWTTRKPTGLSASQPSDASNVAEVTGSL